MNHYDVTIRETLEVKMKVAANSREEAEQFAAASTAARVPTPPSRSGRRASVAPSENYSLFDDKEETG